MAKLLKLRRGTTTQHSSFTGAEGEVTIDTDKDVPVVHDGSTAGGHPVAAEDMANVSSASIAGRLANDSIATSKIAAGALPSDVTVATANLGTTGVTAGAYGSSSAIPIVTVNNKGQVTAASTTAIDSTTIANGTSNVAVANNGDITTTRAGTARHVVDDAGVHVTGTLDVTGTTTTSKVTLNSTSPTIEFEESDGNPDFRIISESGALSFQDADAGPATRMKINSDGHIDVFSNLDCGAGVDVTGNITVTGTVDGVDVATRDTLFGGLTSSSGVLTNGVTATTQSASDNTTKVATTAYVTTGIANAQAFPSGTKMIFQQTSAPTGWTKITSGVDNKALRVVSGTAGSGGSNAFTNTLASRGITANAGNTTATGNISVANGTGGGSVSIANATTGGTVTNHTLSTSEMPSHSHSYTAISQNMRYSGGSNAAFGNSSYNASTGGAGGSSSHSHGFTGSSHNHNANFTGNAHNHNASFSGSAHNHNISVTNLDMAVQYLDVIIASKD